jgi:arylsulfatase
LSARRDWIDLEHDVCYDPSNHWTALTDGQHKYIFHAFDGSEQLFDLTADPHELDDLAGSVQHASMLATWRGRMARHLEPRGPEWVANGRPLRRPKRMPFSPSYPG